MFAKLFFRLSALMLILATILHKTHSAAENKEQEIQDKFVCVLEKGLLSSNRCKDAIKESYFDVEFPEFRCQSLYFFIQLYTDVGCKKEDVLKMYDIFCQRNETNIQCDGSAAASDDPSPTEHFSTEKPVPTEDSATIKPPVKYEVSKQLEILGKNVKCVVETLLSTKQCTRFIKLRTMRFKNFSRGCDELAKPDLNKFNCSRDDMDLLNKVLCEGRTVQCPPPQTAAPDPGQVVVAQLNAIIIDFTDLCRTTVEPMIGDIVKDKNQSCETIDDFKGLCEDEEIFKIKNVLCIDDKKP